MQLEPAILSELALGKFAFIDAGCAAGGSIDHCQRRFGRGRGLGLDWYGTDLETARKGGFAVAHCDLTSVEIPPRCVAFTSFLDFLEHLRDEGAARKILEKFARASRDFLFIRHPSFDDMEYLAGLGLKLYWTDWTGHSNRMRIGDFRRLFESLGWRDYVIQPDFPIADSRHPAVVPATAPPDTQGYDQATQEPKPFIPFDRVLYGKYDIFVRLNDRLDAEEWRGVVSMEGWRAVWP